MDQDALKKLRDYRAKVVQTTAEKLSENIFKSEPHNKTLHETRWEEYYNCLSSEEQSLAFMVFNKKTEELGEIDDYWKAFKEWNIALSDEHVT